MEIEFSFELSDLTRDFSPCEMFSIGIKQMEMLCKEIDHVFTMDIDPSITLKFYTLDGTGNFTFYFADDSTISYQFEREMSRPPTKLINKFLKKFCKLLELPLESKINFNTRNTPWRTYEVDKIMKFK